MYSLFNYKIQYDENNDDLIHIICMFKDNIPCDDNIDEIYHFIQDIISADTNEKVVVLDLCKSPLLRYIPYMKCIVERLSNDENGVKELNIRMKNTALIKSISSVLIDTFTEGLVDLKVNVSYH